MFYSFNAQIIANRKLPSLNISMISISPFANYSEIYSFFKIFQENSKMESYVDHIKEEIEILSKMSEAKQSGGQS